MNDTDTKLFKNLKKEIETKYKLEYPGCKKSINDWKGQEIINLQEELQKMVNGRISEKWFYTHIKPDINIKLPRIDILNMLSKYVGYKDWDDFTFQKSEKKEKDIKFLRSAKVINIILSKSYVIVILIFLMVASVISLNIYKVTNNKYQFCFIDADTEEKISNSKIEIILIRKNESPSIYYCNNDGCIELETDNESLKFIVKAPYYKSDTIIRNINKNQNTETVKLHTDDYALMIHIFSTSKIKDWKKRRNQLDEMISENALIFQIDKKNKQGMEMYNKSEFIDKMTIPLNSLKDIEIIETVYKRNKISMLRFVQ
jgi:hypothetical protein